MGATDLERVEGYTDRRSYAPGEQVTLHCSVTRPGILGDVVPGDGPRLADVVVHRMGADATEVWRRDGVTVHPRPVPADAAAEGCGWPATLAFEVPEHWRPGWYRVSLVGRFDDGPPGAARPAHAGFAVRAPIGSPRSPVLLVLATNTWNAYNDWGGPNLYTGGTQVSFARPFARGFLDRPDPFVNRNANVHAEPDPDVERWVSYVFAADVSPWSGCAGWPQWEAMFVAWAERAGYELDVAVNADLAERPEVMDGHHLVLSVGHDEYWSWEMRDAVDAHVASGGNVAFLSGNTAFWQVRLTDHGDTMVGYKMTAHDDDPVIGTPEQPRLTTMWADPLIGRPEAAMTGVSFTRGGYARIGGATPRGSGGYTVWRPDHWLFEGTGLRYGDVVGAEAVVVGYECDGCALTLEDGLPIPTHEDGCPEGFEVLATAPAHLWSKDDHTDDYPSGLSGMRATGELQEVASVLFGDDSPASIDRISHGHAVLGWHPGGSSTPGSDGVVRTGTMVTTGCTDWAFGLAAGDPFVARITRNLLDHLAVRRSGVRIRRQSDGS